MPGGVLPRTQLHQLLEEVITSQVSYVNLFKVDDECLEAVGCYLSLIVFVAELDEDEDQRQVTTANSFRNQTSVSGVQVPALC